MGTFVFTWSQPASEVYVTGTFDDWKKTVKLDKQNGVFTRQVDLPAADKPILYKFVVDDKWTVDTAMPLESDESGNVNNLLKPADINPLPAGGRSSHGQHPAPLAAGTLLSSVGPGASTVDKAANVPLEKSAAAQEEMPGGASKSNDQTFSVAPLPATAGISNPVNVKPGEPLPPTSSYTSNTVGSNVHTDKAAYEKSDAYPASAQNTLDTQRGAFGVPPVAGTMIPESSLPMNTTATAAASADPGPFVQSSGAGSSTAAMAGQVPLEPRGQAEVAHDADGKEDEGTLKATAAAAGGALAGVAAGAAALAAGVPASIQKAISDMNGGSGTAAEEPSEPAAAVPGAVKSAQSAAHASPEASGNPEAVSEKAAVEDELISKVPRATESGEPAPAVSATQSAVAPQPSTGVFSKDPTIADDSTAAAIAAMDTGSAATPAALQGDPVEAGQGGAQASNGLNAPAAQPAKSAATEAAATKASEKQATLPGSAQRVEKGRQDSRDVSPMTKPAVTSGIEATTASASQGASQAPASSSAAPAAAAESPSTDKKSKRRSFFGKIKDKLKA